MACDSRDVIVVFQTVAYSSGLKGYCRTSREAYRAIDRQFVGLFRLSFVDVGVINGDLLFVFGRVAFRDPALPRRNPANRGGTQT